MRRWPTSGTTVTQSPRVESAQEIADQLIRAANFIDKNQIGSTDDCGFSPFSIDEKPNHGSPDYAREVAFGKIKSRVEGSRMAADKLGLSPASDRGLIAVGTCGAAGGGR